jgi:hypothetical protein
MTSPRPAAFPGKANSENNLREEDEIILSMCICSRVIEFQLIGRSHMKVRSSLAALAALVALPTAVLVNTVVSTGTPSAQGAAATHASAATNVTTMAHARLLAADVANSGSWCRDIIYDGDGNVIYDSGWYEC